MKTSFERNTVYDTARVEEQPREYTDHDSLTTGLGWFSIGLGVSQIFAPGRISRLVGLQNHSTLIRVLGVREIAAGIGILGLRNSAPGLWARVAGDVMDLALLGMVLTSDEADRRKTAVATTAVAGVTALDSYAAVKQTASHRVWRSRRAITVQRSADEVYSFWRDFKNMPRFMKFVESVEVSDGGRRSHWRVATPLGRALEWESQITAERPGELIAWRSVDGSMVPNSGRVQFQSAPNGRGTEVRLEVEGPIPAALLEEDLRRFKRLMETGEIPTTSGQPRGPSRTAVVSRFVHAIEDKGGLL